MSRVPETDTSHFFFGSILVPNELSTCLSEHGYAWESTLPDADVHANLENETPGRAADQTSSRKSPLQKVCEVVESMLDGQVDDPLRHDHGPKAQLYRLQDIKSFLDNARYSDEESISRTLPAILDLLRFGEYRKLKQFDAHFLSGLSALSVKFPQFASVLDYVAASAAVAACGDCVLRMTPLLLTGSPGVGKSAFSFELAQLIGTNYLKIDMAAAQNNADLSGTSNFWANARPSKLFSLFTSAEPRSGEVFGNAVVVLDEIDKAAEASAGMQFDPLASLYSLLEPNSARSYADQCITVPLDVSHTVFVATANNTASINSALLSRFKQFDINIQPEQASAITLNIVGDLLYELRHIDIVFHSKTIDMLTKLGSPRVVRQAAFEGIGHALLQGQDVVLPIHVPTEAIEKRKWGFC